MSLFHKFLLYVFVTSYCGLMFAGTPAKTAQTPAKMNPVSPVVMQRLETELVQKHGEAQRSRIEKGIRQVAGFWRKEDGTEKNLEEFVKQQFLSDQEQLDDTFARMQYVFEQIDGHMLEITKELRRPSDLDNRTLLPIDEILGGYDAGAHLSEDLFLNKFAFIVLLNFPLTTLEERNANGDKWSRRQWSEARLAQRFARRVPPEVSQEITSAATESDRYISNYNVWMHHLLDDKGSRLFPPKMRLISHWNLRDELKSNYAEKDGLPKQRMIQTVMERIVTQTIPGVVVDNPHVDWNPVTNEVKSATAKDAESPAPADLKITATPEPNTRYKMLLNNYKAARKADPYSPLAPTVIDRSFEEDRELPEKRVKEIFEQIMTSPLVPKTAALIQQRLGRPLEPFDIWYNGFKAKGKYSEAELDEILAKKYPTPDAFRKDIPRILQDLGFPKERAEYVAKNIDVEPSRGAGHAWGPERRGDKAHLRTRVEKTGMNYKGYNIAVHELGHNVEQIFSLYDMDQWALHGVPNTAFTEALAFVFQAHDLELLGLAKPDAQTHALKTLNDFWATYEIAGVALVDIAVWNWMYAHPNATEEQLKNATVQISKDMWNKYYAPVFKKQDVVLLGIYSHMIDRMIYLPNYPLGHLIAFQVEEQIDKTGKVGPEFERAAKIGRLTPDAWMQIASGKPVGAESLLSATEKALHDIQ